MINEEEEKKIKEKVKKYMDNIKLPEDLEGIVMEDINKVKKEEKKKMSKKTKIIAGVASFIVVAGVVSAVVFRDVLFKNGDEGADSNGTTTEAPMAMSEDESKESLGDLNINIEDKDLYAVGFDDIAFIENGEVYYGYKHLLSEGTNDVEIQIKKISGISDAISIGAYNLSTDVTKTFYIVTESGKLYRLTNGKDCEALRVFQDYEIKSIVSAEGEENQEFVFILKDNEKIKINTYIEEKDNTVESLGIYSSANITGNKGNVQKGSDLYYGGFEGASFLINGNVYLCSPNKKNQSGDITLNVNKVKNLNDVKNIKGLAIGTDPTITYFAVKESGEVYDFCDTETINRTEIMKSYSVETIISAENNGYDENGMDVYEIKLKLKDGSIVSVYTGKVVEDTSVTYSEISNIQNYLNKVENNGFTQTSFEENSAKGLNLADVLYNLGEKLGDEYTTEELKEVGIALDENGNPYTAVSKFKGSTVNKFINSKLGLDLIDIEYDAGGLIHSDKYDAFYDEHGDTSYLQIKIKSAKKSGNVYEIYGEYKGTTNGATFNMKLEKKSDDEYRFISNSINGKIYEYIN